MPGLNGSRPRVSTRSGAITAGKRPAPPTTFCDFPRLFFLSFSVLMAYGVFDIFILVMHVVGPWPFWHKRFQLMLIVNASRLGEMAS